ncbi:MAG: hypothetical protein R3F61_06540 [Myxococcota bacterium]
MSNPFIPRAQVHAWSEAIGDDATKHQAALTRLLKDQRRLTRFIEENAENLEGVTGGVSVYLTGVIIRMFDLAGGRLRSATWEQIRQAEAKVNAAVPALLPLDDDFVSRAHTGDRAQAHILDEALMALFDRESDSEDEANLEPIEALKTYLMLWVVTEVLDSNWKPASSFQGDGAYEYVHIEPTKREKAEA